MPGGDRTGPRGQGPSTGRGMGPCGGGAQNDNSLDRNQSFGGRFFSGIGRMFRNKQGNAGGGQGRRGGGQRGGGQGRNR